MRLQARVDIRALPLSLALFALLFAGCGETLVVEPWSLEEPRIVVGDFVEVVSGAHHACGLEKSGDVECWGNNDRRQASASDVEFRQVESGGAHSCGVAVVDSSIHCWGLGSGSMSDNGLDFQQASPPDGNFQKVTAGPLHSCAVTESESVECWGAGAGEAGHLWNYGQARPRSGAFSDVSAGGLYTCGLSGDGRVSCWGLGSDENSKTTHLDVGQGVPPSGRLRDLDAGNWHSCGLRPDEEAVCWGAGTEPDQLEGPIEDRLDFDQSVVPDGPFDQIAAGGGHTCGLRPDGTAKCWGLGSVKTRNEATCELCEGEDQNQASPPEGEFIDISAGGLHSCGVRPGGDVECWGGFLEGKLGALRRLESAP